MWHTLRIKVSGDSLAARSLFQEISESYREKILAMGGGQIHSSLEDVEQLIPDAQPSGTVSDPVGSAT